MPWLSKKQERWGNSPAGIKALGGRAAVSEWNQASKDLKLPDKVRHPGAMKKAQNKVTNGR